MASSARNALRLSRAAAPRRAIKATTPSRFLSATSALRVSDTHTNKREVKFTVFGASGQSDRHTLQVPEAAPRLPADSPDAPVEPLSSKVYASMPHTMRNMTVFGKTILVTGGARGLGNHMARACAEAGAKNIILFDVNQELGDKAAAELHDKSGLPVTFYRVDVRDGNAINAAVESVTEQFGAPDVLVNAAGIADSNIKAEDYDEQMFRRLIDINLTGTFLMSKAVGRAMMDAKKPGSIVLVASMSGSVVNYPQEQSCYNASKAGVIQFAKSIASEWAKYKIRVNCISPGYMDTALNRVPALEAQKKIWRSLTPQDRLGDVDELNGLCVFLASDSSSFMTGANVLIDGGYSCY
ncbi:enoyl-(Acyl carrier protein) reductase [Hirsutella rhossiliensis]|uniref:Enoyl-(Acyl carrier protein) reductase domain-containing protein n=1 Tax=Hirsutella rhossiliensis TaxID=111463 RepID=A0A9P8MNK0_9HYPO|nr:enoyl-(Acyl carrier protein) reductase domain-containing protein [Hirsutella rhossiliensis]KAH0958718.1 enoyl-(Acyl carrier protein) reductase domain-containing protein [Hirsutella rhossiliensis]